LEQYLGFYAHRLKVNWEAYGRKDQVVQITDENGNLVSVRPINITGEYDIVIDIMDDIKDDAVKAQRMLNFMQVIGNSPAAQNIDWQEFTKDLSDKIMGTSKYVVPGNEGDAEANARQNLLLMLNNGIPPQLSDNMNLRKHLEIYKAERTRWTGAEDQNPNVVGILDPVIAQLEQRIANPPQQAALPGTPTEAVAGGQIASGAQGGIQ
jgi:hypothetical protein